MRRQTSRKDEMGQYIAWLRDRVLKAGEGFWSSDLMRRITKGASAAWGLKLLSFGVLFLTGIVLGRWLGAEAYGRYSFAITVIILLRLGTALGMPLMLIRDTARYNAKSDWTHLAGLIRFATISNVFAALVVGAALSVALIVVFGWPLPPTPYMILLASPLLLILPLTDNRASILKGFERLAIGHIPDQLIRPTLYLCLLLGLIFWPEVRLTDSNAMFLRLGAESVALLCAFALTARFVPSEVQSAKPSYEVATWTAGFLTFMAIDATHLVYQQTDVIMLGLMRPMDDVGVYRMAANLGLVIMFASDFATAALSPFVSSLWTQGRKEELQEILTRMSRLACLLTAAIYAGLLASTPLLIWFLGDDFSRMTLPLAILGVGHLARSLISGAPALLLMTGGERDGAIAIAITAVVNLGLNAALIPIWGVVGSAIATAFSTVLLGVFYFYRARKRTGLDPSVFGRFSIEELPKAM